VFRLIEVVFNETELKYASDKENTEGKESNAMKMQVNAVLEACLPSTTHEDIPPDHASAVPPRTLLCPLTVIHLHSHPNTQLGYY